MIHSDLLVALCFCPWKHFQTCSWNASVHVYLSRIKFWVTTKDAFNLTELLSSICWQMMDILLWSAGRAWLILCSISCWICNEQRCVSWYTRMKSKKIWCLQIDAYWCDWADICYLKGMSWASHPCGWGAQYSLAREVMKWRKNFNRLPTMQHSNSLFPADAASFCTY
jgi:hypothetical protein